MSAVVINIDGIRARRQTEQAIRDIRSVVSREVARVHAATEERRKRIDALLTKIDDDISWRCPSDSAVPS